MGDSPQLWDEFRPNLYTMTVGLKGPNCQDQTSVKY
jgi:hypothetical protein